MSAIISTAFAESVRESLLKRFLHYVSIDTQSDEASQSFPSTSKQLGLLRLLRDELLRLGLSAQLDEHGYVMATIPATAGCEGAPAIGFIAHVDTSPDLSGAQVRPQIVEDYQGQDIPLGEHYVLRPSDFPELLKLIGHTLITTDGSTLLGADDKAGVAIIMTLTEYLLQHPEIAHGAICIGFTPDEEIGRGVDFFDVTAFGAKFAYTVDGSIEGELEYENFNAAAAEVKFIGRNIHPGYAKGKMRNALELMQEFHRLLPEGERPETTEGYEGFFHLISSAGTVEQATASYIIRDHDHDLYMMRKELMRRIASELNERYGKEVVRVEVRDQYLNMRDKILPHPELIELAKEAMLASGVTPIIRPIRGGTDGARLSYMGLPCPNIFTGGANFHGRYEYASLDTMIRSAETLVRLAAIWSRQAN